MRRRHLCLIITLGLTTQSCDKIPFIGGGSDDTETAADTTSADSVPAVTETPGAQTPDAAAREDVATPQRRAGRQIAQQQPSAPAFPAMDEPWDPIYTGTIDPGMTTEQVIQAWGEPVRETVAGNYSYLYFRNGCEWSCGTFDVVILDRDQVVDAVVRGAGHVYSGISSSPDDRIPEFTPPIEEMPEPAVDLAPAVTQ